MQQLSGEQKLLAVLSHISYFLGGLGFILAPLIIFLLKKEDFFVYHHAKQALVAHITILLVSLIISLSCILLIGFLLLPILGILWLLLLITSLRAAYKAIHGEYYSYPFIQKLVEKL